MIKRFSGLFSEIMALWVDKYRPRELSALTYHTKQSKDLIEIIKVRTFFYWFVSLLKLSRLLKHLNNDDQAYEILILKEYYSRLVISHICSYMAQVVREK